MTLSTSSHFCYITKPLVDMREDKTPASKVVSQALFAEQIAVNEEESGWSLITTPDGYLGWIPSCAYVARQTPYQTNCSISRLAAHIYLKKDIEYGPNATLPYGSQLHALDDADPRWIALTLPEGQEVYIQKGDVVSEQHCRTKGCLPTFSQKFLGLPYTWGGRSSFGFDCSGFVQMLYGYLGIHLQRDARQQILDPRMITCEIDAAEPGDLLFFGKAEDQIKHVALSLGHGKFIHATSRENQPWIRISKLSDFEWSGNAQAYYPYRIGRRLQTSGLLRHSPLSH